MTNRTSAAVAVAMIACGGGGTSTGPAHPGDGSAASADATGLPAVSLERIERIAQACADPAGAPLDWTTIDIARGAAGAWRVRVDEQRGTGPAGAQPTYLDFVVDPAASTCDGKPIASEPAAGDAGIDAVAAIARRCHADKIDPARTDVIYHRLATGAIDRGRYDVMFHEPGATTFPTPHYLVDAAAETCTKVDDRF